MADTDHVLNLAAIIREVDGTHSKGAAALAESILDHPRFRAVVAAALRAAALQIENSSDGRGCLDILRQIAAELENHQ